MDRSRDLLDRICRGEASAFEQLVAEYGPYLRVVVRRGLSGRLRAKFDSLDVVQSVWAHLLPALRGGGWSLPDETRLRALLLTVARRRLVSRYRHHRAAVEREEPGGADFTAVPQTQTPRPSEVAQANDTWQLMLALCPRAHRGLLRLRRQGFSVEEIASRTGMHAGSVRRVLRQVAHQLALREAPVETAA
jgi:RNA polymerase sigma factor (sigma-70 family)